MISSLSEKIILALIGGGKIEEENRELLTYGMTQGMRMCLNVLTTLLIGALMGMWWQGLLFLSAFIPIRSFAGGFHASTPFRCYWYSVGIVAISLALIRYPAAQAIINAALICSILAILSLAPVGSGKKSLSGAERGALRKKAHLALYAGLGCMAALSVAGFPEASSCIKMAIAVAGLLAVGGWKNSNGKHSSMRGQST